MVSLCGWGSGRPARGRGGPTAAGKRSWVRTSWMEYRMSYRELGRGVLGLACTAGGRSCCRECFQLSLYWSVVHKPWLMQIPVVSLHCLDSERAGSLEIMNFPLLYLGLRMIRSLVLKLLFGWSNYSADFAPHREVFGGEIVSKHRHESACPVITPFFILSTLT